MEIFLLALGTFTIFVIGAFYGIWLQKRRQPPVDRVWVVWIASSLDLVGPHTYGPFLDPHAAARWQTSFNEEIAKRDLQHRVWAHTGYLGAHCIPQRPAAYASDVADRIFAMFMAPMRKTASAPVIN